jgi:hypothetical protein
MGTRHLVMIAVDGDIKLAKYGQWDGYPTGVGKDIAEFIKSRTDTNVLTEQAKKLKFYTKIGKKLEETINKNIKEYPELTPDCSGNEILELIESGKVSKTINDFDFGYDSLFCEWAYLLDLTKKTLTVFKGFNESRLKKDELFYREKNYSMLEKKDSSSSYCGVRKILEVPFDAPDILEQVVALEKEEEEDDE